MKLFKLLYFAFLILAFPAQSQVNIGIHPQTTAVGTNTYTASISPAITSYVTGQRYTIKFTNGNNGAATLNLNAIGPKAIVKNGSSPLISGDINAGQILFLVYDGTNFQIIGDGVGWDFINIVSLGADNTGVNDVSAVINTATALGKPVYFPKGTYLISASVTLPDNAVLFGDGRKLSIIKLTTNITAFNCGFKNQISNLEFLGTYGSGGTTAQIAISINGKHGCTIENNGFSFISGWCVYLTLMNNATPPANGGYFGNKVINNYGETCQGGVFSDVRGEYTIISQNSFNDGGYGVRIAGGNCLVANNNLTINTYGVYLEGGANNAHGSVIGNFLNHCSTGGIYATGVTLGMLIEGNMIYASRIQMLNSDGITLVNNDIEFATDITVNTCTNIRFINNRFTTNPTWTITGTTPYIQGPELVTAKTANYTILPNDANKIFNNTGAAGAVNFTLPTAFVGTKLTFYIDVAQSLTVTAPASTTIRIAGSVSVAAGNITANVIGNSVTLKCISATQWVAKSHEGTWTIN